MDLDEYADIINGYFGGQVGAPCGCIGCFDEYDHIQGNWQYQRKKQKGNFHAKDYNSLICACEGNAVGRLCNPGDREIGPEPRRAPANLACFSGKGTLKQRGNGKNVAFRVEVEDRGEPGAGQNAGPSDDVMRIRIWVPKGQENIDDLANGACCTNPNPTGDASRKPDIDDGGNIVHGNLQIHPQIPSHVDICPVPGTQCPNFTPEN